MKRSLLAAGFVLLAACLPLAGCGHGGDRDPQTLRTAVATDFKSLDPAVVSDAETVPYVAALYQGLLDCDDDGQLVPWAAAEMPDVSANMRVYTFRIRQGVHFANGRELEAADFVYSFERIFNPSTKSPWPSFLDNIRGAKTFMEARGQEKPEGEGPRPNTVEPLHVAGLSAPDRFTFRVELEDPDLSFLWRFTLPFTYAVPREEVEHYGAEFYRHPCGTGPLILTEWQRGLRLRYGRNPHYDGPHPPGYEVLEVDVGFDDVTCAMMFERGELDFFASPSRPDYVRFLRDPRLRSCVHSLPLNATTFLIMNCELEPFTDRRVRQAVCLAVDQERILQVLSHRGLPARSLVPPGIPGHVERPATVRDLDKARRLLTEAGYPNGIKDPIPLWYISDTERWGKIAEVVQQDLEAIGITVVLQKTAYNVCIDSVGRRKQVPFAILGWTEDYPDPGDFLNALCDGRSLQDSDNNNKAFYNNEKVNERLAEAAKETDAGKRLALYQQAENLVLDDAPYCVIYHDLDTRICQPWVKGFRIHPMWLVRLDKLSLERP